MTEENKEVDSKTHLFSIEEFEKSLVDSTIKEVYMALKEKGYNPTNQLIGYIMSGDPGYISSYKESRSKITSIERSKILEVMINEYVTKLWDI